MDACLGQGLVFPADGDGLPLGLGAAKLDGGQGGAAVKGRFADLGEAGGQNDLGKAHAALEHPVARRRNALRKLQRLYLRAGGQGRAAKMGNLGRQIQAR